MISGVNTLKNKKIEPAPADICIICEGSYPYIRGGVSSWIHQILQNYPDLTFDVVVLVANDQDELVSKYDLPSNLRTIYNVPIRRKVPAPIFSPKKTKHFPFNQRVF